VNDCKGSGLVDSVSALLIFSVFFFLVALLYSSVGHGGASGYLAILSFAAVAPAMMSSTALIVNIIVSSLAFFNFYRAGHFSLRLVGPFLITSIPAALLGGILRVESHVYFLLLAGVLLFAAFRLLLPAKALDGDASLHPPALKVALPSGFGLGALSGLLGVGGGIFLSPLILFMGWGGPRAAAASSAIFILLNSIAGIAGRIVGGTFAVGSLLPFMGAAFLGGLCGSTLGARRLSGITLKRLLGVVLIVAALKLVVTHLG
jgi:uncharacterized protein